jgi:membrane-associated protein
VDFLHPEHLIETFGLAGLLIVIFLESGVFPAPLPGDSLLFTAGLFAAADKYDLHIVPIVAGSFVCAVAGAQIGYEIGERYGTKLFKPEARFFKPEYAERSHEFFERQGPKAVLLARFIPVVRTIAPIMAGVSVMHRRTFVFYNVLGAVIWAVGLSVAGFLLGDTIGEDVDKYLLPIVAVIVIVSLIPPALEYRKHRRKQAAERAAAPETPS